MNGRWLPFVLLLYALLPVTARAAGDAPVLPGLKPEECPAWQVSQGVTVGAVPYVGEKRCKELLGQKEPCKLGLLPFLLIIRNDNKFAVSLGRRGVSLVEASGNRLPAVDPSRRSGREQDEPRLGRGGKGGVSGGPRGTGRDRIPGEGGGGEPVPGGKGSEGHPGGHSQGRPDGYLMPLQMEIAPGETVRCVVLFRAGKEEANLEGSRLYLSEIYSMETGEELIYFEFDVKLPPEEKGGKNRR